MSFSPPPPSAAGARAAILSLVPGASSRAGVAPARRGMWGKERLYTHLCPRPGLYRHQAMKDLDVLAAAGIPAADLRLRLFFLEEQQGGAPRNPPGSGAHAGAPEA